MDTAVRSRDNCRLCGSTNIELALPMNPSPIGDAYVTQEDLSFTQDIYPLSLYMCNQCYHLQAIDIVNPDILFGNYIYSTSTSPGLVEHFRLYAQELIKKIDCAKNSFVVEIGSNDGSLLRAFKNQGMRVLGVDPAKEVAKKAIQDGLETITTFFSNELAEHIKTKYGYADIVAANNVFAHLDNKIDFIKGVKSLLSPEGVFVFEVSYLVDMIENNVFDTIYHEHLCHHRVAPLEAFLNRYGMQLFDVQRVQTKGGSIRGFAKLMTSKRAVKPIIKDLISLETKMNLDNIETYKKFSKHLDKIKQELHEHLNLLKAQGKSIVGYGASTPVTTTVYQFELGDYLDYMVDDNPIKQGRFSPGHHLPVYPSTDLYANKPDCVIILAWQYADLIMNKQQRFLDEGGIFIVPIPSVQVYKNS